MTPKYSKGMTLIELLVVILIMMTMLGIVGGSTVSSVDRAKAQGEFISLHNLIKRVSLRAFVSGAGVKLHLYENRISLIGQEWEAVESSYEYLRFSDQVLSFDRNGFPSRDLIKVHVQNQEKEIDLASFMGQVRHDND